MDFSKLLTAIKEQDEKYLNEKLEHLVPRLIRFLKVHMGASQEDAEDCSQQALLVTLEAIHEDKLNEPERLLTYLFSTCKNTYLNNRIKKTEIAVEDLPSIYYRSAGQLERLVEEERMNILRECIGRLKEEHRTFIAFWIKHPDYDAEMIAEHFKISVNNAWTRKHRIVKDLNACYEEKIHK